METHNEKHHCKKNKKGILAAIWESMTKTGGCCGSGESCGSEPTSDKNKPNQNKMDKQGESKNR
ncbi:hypothetical protein GAMM_110051 [Gammaproteobacteria bacterium]